MWEVTDATTQNLFSDSKVAITNGSNFSNEVTVVNTANMGTTEVATRNVNCDVMS